MIDFKSDNIILSLDDDFRWAAMGDVAGFTK